MHGERLLPMTGSQAVGASVAASDDYHALAGSQNLDGRIDRVAKAAPILLRKVFHCVMDSLQLTAGNLEIARLLGPTRKYNGVELAAQILHGNILSDFRPGDELHAFGRHLFQAAIDNMFLQLELRNAVAQQSADAVCFFVNHNRVTGAA